MVQELDDINPGLARLDEAPNLETPQACVENCVLSSRDGAFDRAARPLNCRLVDGITETTAAVLAAHLFFVLNQELWIDWESLPDRADGMMDREVFTDAGPLVGETRRGLRLGSVSVDGRQTPIRLQCVKAESADPVWLFSAHTVESIRVLYEAHGPGGIDEHLPNWAAARGWQRMAIWKWIALGLVLVIAPCIAWLAASVLKRVQRSVLANEKRLLTKFEWPIIAVVTTVLAWISVE